MKKPLSGLLIFGIAVLVGTGAGLIVLALAASYTDDQKDQAIHAAQKRDRQTAYLQSLDRYNDSIAACGRGNILRKKINIQGRVQTKFLKIARTARLRAVKTADNPVDKKLNQDAADQYTELIDSQAIVPLVDCLARFHKPAPPQ